MATSLYNTVYLNVNTDVNLVLPLVFDLEDALAKPITESYLLSVPSSSVTGKSVVLLKKEVKYPVPFSLSYPQEGNETKKENPDWMLLLFFDQLKNIQLLTPDHRQYKTAPDLKRFRPLCLSQYFSPLFKCVCVFDALTMGGLWSCCVAVLSQSQ